MASSRTRVTTAIRHDNPVPGKRRKKSNATVIAIIFLLALAFLIARTNQRGGLHRARPASVTH